MTKFLTFLLIKELSIYLKDYFSIEIFKIFYLKLINSFKILILSIFSPFISINYTITQVL